LGIDEAANMTYGNVLGWKNLNLSEDNLVVGKDGKKYLIVVGFGEKPEEELTTSPEYSDVTQDELHTGTQKLAERFVDCRVDMEGVEIIKVYLGSSEVKRPDKYTGELTVTDRQVAEEGGINLYLDTWRCLVYRIGKKIGEEPGMVLRSRVREYRDLFKAVTGQLGKKLFTKESAPDNVPILVYEQITDNTVNAAQAQKKETPSRNIYALTSSIQGDDMAKRAGLQTICSARELGDTTWEVIEWLREGKNPEEIQQILDERWGSPETAAA